MQLVVFRLDAQRYALPLGTVERIVRAVEVTPLPGAPRLVLGAVDVAGEVLPVFDLRRRLSLPVRQVGPDDHFLIAVTARRKVAMVIDEAEAVIEREPPAAGPDGVLLYADQFSGVVQLDDGMLLVYDLEKFLSADEAHALDRAMQRA